jgi:hypothetical protein
MNGESKSLSERRLYLCDAGLKFPQKQVFQEGMVSGEPGNAKSGKAIKKAAFQDVAGKECDRAGGHDLEN